MKIRLIKIIIITTSICVFYTICYFERTPLQKSVEIRDIPLTDIIWNFGDENGAVFTSNLRFRHDGVIGVYKDRNEHTWNVENNRLMMYDVNGRASSVFSECHYQFGRLYLKAANNNHFLEQRCYAEGRDRKDAYSGYFKNHIIAKSALLALILGLLISLTALPRTLLNLIKSNKAADIQGNDTNIPDKISRHLDRRGMAYILAFFSLLRLNYAGFIPIWDGYIYITGLLKAVLSPFDIFHFNTATHVSFAYNLLLSIGQYLNPGNQYLISIANLALSLLAAYSFYKIVCFFFYDQNNMREIQLVTFVVVFNPIFFANSINLNLDFPVVVFFICSICALLYGKMALFSVCALFLVFSKETGILLYGILIFFFTSLFAAKRLIHALRERGRLSDIYSISESRGTVRHAHDRAHASDLFTFFTKSALLFSPFFALLAYYAYCMTVSNRFALWNNTKINLDSFSFIINFDMCNRIPLTRLIEIFIMNFQWTLTAIVIFFLSKTLFQKLSRKEEKRPDLSGNQKDFLWVIFAVLLGFTYIITLYPTYTNPRYILPAIPLYGILFYFCLLESLGSRFLRKAILLIICGLTLCQNFSSIDPVSSAIFGEFNFGNHAMLKMVSLTGEHAGIAGRDQLVYNAEYTVIAALVQKLYYQLPVEETTSIIVNTDADFHVFTPVDARTKERSLRYVVNQPHMTPAKYSIREIKNMAPEERPRDAYYVNFPWMAPPEDDMLDILPFYTVNSKSIVEYNGYSLDVFKLEKKH